MAVILSIHVALSEMSVWL